MIIIDLMDINYFEINNKRWEWGVFIYNIQIELAKM